MARVRRHDRVHPAQPELARADACRCDRYAGPQRRIQDQPPALRTDRAWLRAYGQLMKRTSSMNRKLWLSLTMCMSWFLLATSGAGVPALVSAATPASLAATVALSGREAPPTVPQAPADTPYTLLYSGVTAYTIADPKIFWYSLPACVNPPPHAPSAPATTLYETISRMPTYGGSIRTLFQHPVNSLCPSGQDVNSNIVSDGSYVYWISSLDAGLVKLSVNANVGDKPAVVNA